MKKIKTLFINKTTGFIQRFDFKNRKGQSLLELAIILPVMIMMLLTIAEGALFMGRYMDLLDLTREAARSASRDDPFYIENTVVDKSTISTLGGSFVCPALGSDSSNVNFYYKAACFFSPPQGSVCSGAGQSTNFCSGYNRYVDFDLRTDDVVISAYTVKDDAITDVWPQYDKATPTRHGNYWALSNKTGDPDNRDDEIWKRNCDGTLTTATEPDINETYITNIITNDYGAPLSRGYVAVEVYYCYHSPLAILLYKPLRVHAYTIMPLANVQPTSVASTSTATLSP